MVENSARTLYAGLDETNHGRYPELWVAVFSFDKDDVTRFTDEGSLSTPQLLKEIRLRDFRFLEVRRDEAERYRDKLLAYVTSCLITDYRFHNRADKLELKVDGRATIIDKSRIRERLRGFPEGVVIEGVKKSKKGYKYPHILALADALAYYLFYEQKKSEEGARRINFIV